MSTDVARVSAGQSTGGQFAALARAEPDTTLAAAALFPVVFEGSSLAYLDEPVSTQVGEHVEWDAFVDTDALDATSSDARRSSIWAAHEKAQPFDLIAFTRNPRTSEVQATTQTVVYPESDLETFMAASAGETIRSASNLDQIQMYADDWAATHQHHIGAAAAEFSPGAQVAVDQMGFVQAVHVPVAVKRAETVREVAARVSDPASPVMAVRRATFGDDTLMARAVVLAARDDSSYADLDDKSAFDAYVRDMAAGKFSEPLY